MRSILTTVVFCALVPLTGLPAHALVTSTTQHSTLLSGFDGVISNTDLIHGLIGTELAGDTGWHAAVSDPLDKLPAFTDGVGDRTGLTGLLNDFPAAGQPTKLVQYDLGGPKDIASIRIFSGNGGADGRVFSTTVVRYSTNNGGSFTDLGYFQSDPSGTLNPPAGAPGQQATLVTIFDNSSPTLLANVTNLQFRLYAVDNTQGQMRDPYDGLNPYSGADDGLSAPIVSPRILELDVIAVPEPLTFSLLGLGGLIATWKRRRKTSGFRRL